MRRVQATLIRAAIAVAVGVPLAAAAASPLLEWRRPVYIAAGFGGSFAFLLLQPLPIGGQLPGLAGHRGRRAHR